MITLDVSSLIDMKESFGDRFRRLRLAAGLSRQALADHVGVTRAAIALVENGQTKSMEAANLLKAAEALNVDPQDLQDGERELGRPPKVAVMQRVRRYNQTKEVPIVGYVIANPSDDGFFDDMDYPAGSGESYVPWATRDPNAYAVRVRGDSMQPRFRAGEIVIVEPSAAVIPGDDIVVRTKNGRKMVKRLLFQRNGDVTLGSVNDRHPPLTISLEEIESMHHIAGSVQRGTSTKES